MQRLRRRSSTGQKEQEQEQQAISDPDSPMLDPNKKEGGLVDLETAAHDGVFGQFVADQLLSKGQRINIGSPDTYFRPRPMPLQPASRALLMLMTQSPCSGSPAGLRPF